MGRDYSELARNMKKESFAPEFFETGNIALDMIVSNGRGLPVGGTVTFFAGPGAGKSTTCIDVAKRVLTRWRKEGLPYKVLYIDTEKSEALMNAMGMDEFRREGSFLVHNTLATFKSLEDYCSGIVADDDFVKDVRLIIVDSIQGIVCKRELEAGIESGDFGDAVRFRNKFYKTILPLLKTKGVACLFVSQQRKKQAATAYENPNKSAMADGDKHYADVLLYFSKTSNSQNSETKKKEVVMATSNEKVGVTDSYFVTMKIDGDKNRYGTKGEAKTLMRYGKGCDNWWVMHNLLSKWGHLKNKGSASSPKWNIDDALFAATEQSFKPDSTKAELRTWLRHHMTAIKDFLKSNGEYCNMYVADDSEEEDLEEN